MGPGAGVSEAGVGGGVDGEDVPLAVGGRFSATTSVTVAVIRAAVSVPVSVMSAAFTPVSWLRNQRRNLTMASLSCRMDRQLYVHGRGVGDQGEPAARYSYSIPAPSSIARVRSVSACPRAVIAARSASLLPSRRRPSRTGRIWSRR